MGMLGLIQILIGSCICKLYQLIGAIFQQLQDVFVPDVQKHPEAAEISVYIKMDDMHALNFKYFYLMEHYTIPLYDFHSYPV